MKIKNLLTACLLTIAMGAGAWVQPEIVPEWFGAEPGVWTMDMAAATNAAAANGKYTVFMISGQWWCPDCTSLDANVLANPDWEEYVAANGYYLTLVDFPYRDGVSAWTWLWDTNYVKKVATNLTMETAAQKVIDQYEIENYYSAPGANVQSNEVSGYVSGRVAYPTFFLLRPDGTCAGRINAERIADGKNRIDRTPGEMIRKLEQLKLADPLDEIDDYWQRATELDQAKSAGLMAALAEPRTLSEVDAADWYTFDVTDEAIQAADKSPVKWTFRFGENAEIPAEFLTVQLYADPAAAPIATHFAKPLRTGAGVFFEIAEAGKYYLKVSAKDEEELQHVIGYTMSYGYGDPTPEIIPEWIGAEPGVWTMDYNAATNASHETGKYTLLMTSGQWWCPDCVSFDKNVLSTPEWDAYVRSKDFYLACVDFPYRDGVHANTWLWDTNYVKTVATNMTMETARQEVVNRYQIEDHYSIPGAQTQTIDGKEYGRIAYPTLLLIRPDGTCAGRINAERINNGKEKIDRTVEEMTRKIDQLISADQNDEKDDFWQRANVLTAPECVDVDTEYPISSTLSETDPVDWYQITVSKDFAGRSLSLTFSPSEDFETRPIIVQIFKDPEKSFLQEARLLQGAKDNTILFENLEATTYYVKVLPNDDHLQKMTGYRFSYKYSESLTDIAFTSKQVKARNSSSYVDLKVKINGANPNSRVFVTCHAQDGSAINGEDYEFEDREFGWEADEKKTTKLLRVPLIPADEWKGERSFFVELYRTSSCQEDVLLSSCEVVLTESHSRKAGLLQFKNDGEIITRAGEPFELIVSREKGTDGVVTGAVSYTYGSLKNKEIGTHVWGNRDDSEYAFVFTPPVAPGCQEDQKISFKLSVSGGASLGRPSSLRGIVRDETMIRPFDQVNKEMFDKKAGYKGDFWFEGTAEGSSDPIFRSAELTEKGTSLRFRVSGPSIVSLETHSINGAKVAISLGRTVLTNDPNRNIRIAIPKGSQTLTIDGEKGGGADSYVTAAFEQFDMEQYKYSGFYPFDKTSVAVTPDFELVGLPTDLLSGGVSYSDPEVFIETYAGKSSSRMEKISGSAEDYPLCWLNYYPSHNEGCTDAGPFRELLSTLIGKKLYWRMDVVFEDHFGNRAVQKGETSSIDLVAADSPVVKAEAGTLPDGCVKGTQIVKNAQLVLLHEGFDETTLPASWTLIDGDGDGYNWYAVLGNDGKVYDGTGGCVTSASYINYVGALTPDNWLISPAITIPATATGANLTFYVVGQDEGYQAENYGVYVSTTGTNVVDFTSVFQSVSTEEYEKKTVDLGAYAGQTIHIAFRHYNSCDEFRINIDEVEVSCSDHPPADDFECVTLPEMTVGVKVNCGPFPVSNLPADASVSVSVRNGRLPSGISAVVEDGNLWIRGIPTRETEEYLADLFLTVRFKEGKKSVTEKSVSLRVDTMVRPLEKIDNKYNGYQVQVADDGTAAADYGTASVTIGKSGSISGKFAYLGTNFTFSAKGFDARTNDTFYVNDVEAKKSRTVLPVSFRLRLAQDPNDLQDIQLRVADSIYWLYQDQWRTDEGKDLLESVEGAYTAALPVSMITDEGAPNGTGYMNVTVKSSGTVSYAGMTPDGKSFSGSSPLFHVVDCCNLTGYRWVFYLYAKPSGYSVAGSGLYGLVCIQPNETRPEIRYLTVADDNAVQLVNQDPKSSLDYAPWKVALDVEGGSFDPKAKFEPGATWTLAEDLWAPEDYAGSSQPSGYNLESVPTADQVFLTAISEKRLAFEQNDWNMKLNSYSSGRGIVQFMYTLEYTGMTSSGRESVRRRTVSAKGIFIQNSLSKPPFMAGFYQIPDKGVYLDSHGKERTYSAPLSLHWELDYLGQVE